MVPNPPVRRDITFWGTGLSESHQVTFAYKRAVNRWNAMAPEMIVLE
jgi:hypothetical protein